MKELEEYRDLLFEKKSFAQVAITRKNGDPHVTPLWFDLSENDLSNNILNINTATGRVKSNNIQIGDKIALCIMDPDNPYRYLGIKGSVTSLIMGPEAETHIDLLALKYLGEEKYPYRNDKEKRIKIPIKVQKIYGN